jgi:hypothetical protein
MSTKRAKRAKNQENPTSSDRRRFLNQALAASAGVAISRLMPHLYALPLPPGCSPSPLAANELVNPGEITSVGTTLRSVLVVHDEKRTVPTLTGQTFTLRAYEGYSGNKIDPARRVTKPGFTGQAQLLGQRSGIPFRSHCSITSIPHSFRKPPMVHVM